MAQIRRPFLNNCEFEYDGNAKSPDVSMFDPNTMLMSGTSTATEVGEYVITCQLKDPVNCTWDDGTTDDVSLSWSIVGTNEGNIPGKGKIVTLDQLGTVKNYIDGKVAVASNSEVEAMFSTEKQ